MKPKRKPDFIFNYGVHLNHNRGLREKRTKVIYSVWIKEGIMVYNDAMYNDANLIGIKESDNTILIESIIRPGNFSRFDNGWDGIPQKAYERWKIEQLLLG